MMKLVDAPSTGSGQAPADDLVERARAGDADARNRLVARHYGAVWSLARKLVRDDATASDVAQETFLRAFARLAQYDGRHRFSSWLFKIATNHVRDLHRRPVPAPAEPEPAEAAETILARTEDIARVRRALDALPTETRAAMTLHLQEELTVPEIAFVLDLTEDAVRNKIHRGLQKVRDLLARNA
jgi:RNA polymerase sigma-70 factor (ECF subfamily)